MDSARTEPILLKVATTSDVKSVARAIVKYHEEGREIEISSIGPQSLNQAVKAAAIAQEEFLAQGIELSMLPRFETLHKDGQRLSGLRLTLRVQPVAAPPAAAARRAGRPAKS